ncbi:MAG: rhodanese-like domain-containing protein [Anaerofustis sp.]
MFNGLFGSKGYKNISADEAKERLNENKNAVLIDVRSKDEHKQGHIPGSKNIPLDQIDQIEKIVKDKDKELIVYCLSGARASSACGALCQMGYTNVSNMGGIRNWPYEIKRG